ncbi:MAG TPA: oligosaccharide flippase family protein [Chloroflexota bacterium]|nr:oligosaccharide flippase family protein [Chloroflexota bacterium]HUM67382.1 oligosaccharide flippase family protein [Chloroflexota bacterium]
MENLLLSSRNTLVKPNKLATNSLVIMITRLVGPGGSFLFWALAARMISAQELGLASAALAAAAFLSSMAQMGIGFALIRYLPHEKNPIRLTNLALEAVGVLSVVIALLFILGVQVWSPALVLLRSHWLVTLAFIVTIVAYSLIQLLNAAFVARRQPVLSFHVSSTQTILSIFFFLMLTFWLDGYLAVIVAYLFSFIISLVLAVFAFLPRSEPGFQLTFTIPQKLRTPFSRYAVANHAAQQLIQAPGNLMTIVVINMLGPNVSGFFFVAWAIVQGVFMVAGSVAYSLLAEGANKPELTATFTRQAFKLGLPVAAAFTLFLLLLGKPLLAIFGQEYVQNSLVPLWLLSLSIIPSVTIAIFFSMLRIRSTIGVLVILAFIWLVFSLATTTFFMWKFGVNGVAFGWSLSQIALASVLTILWKRRCFLQHGR